jgi:hypothetical protein
VFSTRDASNEASGTISNSKSNLSLVTRITSHSLVNPSIVTIEIDDVLWIVVNVTRSSLASVIRRQRILLN